ncbi:MAG: fibronectin type III domain-containing protein [Methanomassiliicoccales archaeon]|nr:fibronectin type III domain-containing protein [Methanomassiliicoccales archaeon]
MLRAVSLGLILFLFLMTASPLVEAEAVLGAPMNFVAERDGAHIYLSWEAPADNVTVLCYNVYRGTDPGHLELYDTVDANFTAGYDSEVLRGTTYYYAISANGTDGEGDWSQIVKVPPPSDEYSTLIMTVVLSVVVVTLLFAYWKGKGSE